MMDATIEQKRVLVVGGSSGIGLAVANLAQQKGAHVIVASRRASKRVKALPKPLNSLETVSFDIASAYLWLIVNTYVTGSVMVVDGGARLI